MKVSNLLKQIGGIFGLICLVAFGAFLIYSYAVNEPRAAVVQTALEREFQRLDPLPECCRDSYQAGHKTDLVWVRGRFSTDQSFEEIRRYYETKLTAAGWKFHRQKDLRDWGRDLGGKTVEYCKGEYSATIEYDGMAAGGRSDCAISLDWGGDSLIDKWNGDVCR